MLRPFRALAFVLAFLLTPGSGELVESAAHWVAEGHLAHAVDDASHEPHGDEHGCTGVMHSCACHGSAAVAFFDVERGPGDALSHRWSAGSAVGHRRSAGHELRIERPPIA